MANLEEFTDPANYDLEQAAATRRRLPYYEDLVRRFGGPVLDLACGSGLVTIPIAALCDDVTGVDLSVPMLRHARAKSSRDAAHINWIEADIRTLDLGRAFELILLTGNAFQALLTRQDQQALLHVVRRQLSASGVFVFETRNPSGHDLSDNESEEEWYTYTSEEGHAVRVTGTQRYDPIAQLMNWTTFRRWHVGSQLHERTSRITCRFTHPHELPALLADAGLDVAWQHGDWSGSPVSEKSQHIITACRVPG